MIGGTLTQALLGVVLVLACLVAGLGWFSWTQEGRISSIVAQKQQIEEALQSSQEALKASEAISASAARKKRAIERETARVRASVQASIDAEPSWATQPVPEGVQIALIQAFPEFDLAPVAAPERPEPVGVRVQAPEADSDPPSRAPSGLVQCRATADRDEWGACPDSPSPESRH